MTVSRKHQSDSTAERAGLAVILLLFAATLILVPIGCSGDSSKEGPKSAASAQKNPTEKFILKDIHSKPYQWSQFLGKPFVVNFWATWCGPCHRETPVLKKLYQEYHPKGLEIVAISLDDDRTRHLVIPFVDRYQIPWIVLYGTEDAARAFNLGPGIPTTIFFDGQGNETGRIVGAQSELAFRQQLDKLFQ